MAPSVHDLYRVAVKADDAFTAALVDAYGSRADLARYQRTYPGQPAVEAAAQAAMAAQATYLAACRAAQGRG